MLLVQLSNSKGQLIHTDLTPEISKILIREGYEVFEIVKSSNVEISESAWEEVDKLVTPSLIIAFS